MMLALVTSAPAALEPLRHGVCSVSDGSGDGGDEFKPPADSGAAIRGSEILSEAQKVKPGQRYLLGPFIDFLRDKRGDGSIRLALAERLSGFQSPQLGEAWIALMADRSESPDLRLRAADYVYDYFSYRLETSLPIADILLRIEADPGSPDDLRDNVIFLMEFYTEDVRIIERLKKVADNDPNPGLREVASAVLSTTAGSPALRSPQPPGDGLAKASDSAMKVLAKSVHRELAASRFSSKDMVTFAMTFLSLIGSEARASPRDD
jgi:hypothetical protein